MKIIKENNNYLEKEEVLGGDLIPYYKDINDLEALFSYIPEGIILPYIPHDKTMSIIDINAFLYDYDFVICDGSEFFNVDSSVFNVAGRFLPKLNDEYFLMGSSTGGTVFGNNFLQPHRHQLSFDVLLGYFAGSTNVTHNHGSSLFIDMGFTAAEHKHDHQIATNSTVLGFTTFELYDYNSIRKAPSSPITYYAYPWLASGDFPNQLYKPMTITHGTHAHPITLTINTGTGMSTNRGYTKIDHTHQYECLGTVGSGTSITLTDNRPKYIKTYFIIKFR